MKHRYTQTLSVVFLAGALGLGASAFVPSEVAAKASIKKEVAASITEADVIAAQNAWGDALVKISTTYDEQGIDAAKRLAESVIDSAYGYNLGPVLFKPTLAAPPTTFRTTREGALSYFVGGNDQFAGDKGFALKHWRSYKITNSAIFIDGNVAISMGNVSITDRDGKVTVVDKTWGYTRDKDGKLRIILHHSSLPYSAH